MVLSGLAVIVAAGDRIRLEHQHLLAIVWAALLVVPPLFVALAMVMQPWIFAVDLQVGRPAAEIGQFFGDSFQRRTGRPLAIVAGDPRLAALVALATPRRPSLYLECDAGATAVGNPQDIAEKGAVVVWPATDTAGAPPPEIKARSRIWSPDVPRAFDRALPGRACRCCGSAGA